jgi:hypothetical protein
MDRIRGTSDSLESIDLDLILRASGELERVAIPAELCVIFAFNRVEPVRSGWTSGAGGIAGDESVGTRDRDIPSNPELASQLMG